MRNSLIFSFNTVWVRSARTRAPSLKPHIQVDKTGLPSHQSARLQAAVPMIKHKIHKEFTSGERLIKDYDVFVPWRRWNYSAEGIFFFFFSTFLTIRCFSSIMIDWTIPAAPLPISSIHRHDVSTDMGPHWVREAGLWRREAPVQIYWLALSPRNLVWLENITWRYDIVSVQCMPLWNKSSATLLRLKNKFKLQLLFRWV